MRIITIGSDALAARIAEHLRLPHVHEVHEIVTDDFVLSEVTLAEARALDAVLRSRGSEVEAVLVAGPADEAVLQHYLGRVIELEAADAFEQSLDALREVLLAA